MNLLINGQLNRKLFTAVVISSKEVCFFMQDGISSTLIKTQTNNLNQRKKILLSNAVGRAEVTQKSKIVLQHYLCM